MNNFIPNELDFMLKPELKKIPPHQIDLEELAKSHLTTAVDLAEFEYFTGNCEMILATHHINRFNEIAELIGPGEQDRMLLNYDKSRTADSNWHVFKLGGYLLGYFDLKIDFEKVIEVARQIPDYVSEEEEQKLDGLGYDFLRDMRWVRKRPRVILDDKSTESPPADQPESNSPMPEESQSKIAMRVQAVLRGMVD